MSWADFSLWVIGRIVYEITVDLIETPIEQPLLPSLHCLLALSCYVRLSLRIQISQYNNPAIPAAIGDSTRRQSHRPLLHMLHLCVVFLPLHQRRSPVNRSPCSNPRSSSSPSSSSPSRLSLPPRLSSSASETACTPPTARTKPTSAASPPSSKPKPPYPTPTVPSGTGLTGCEPPPAASSGVPRTAPPASPAPSGKQREHALTTRTSECPVKTALSDLPISLLSKEMMSSAQAYLKSWLREWPFRQLDLDGFFSYFCRNGVIRGEAL